MTVDIDSLFGGVIDAITDFADEYSATEAVDHAARCANLKEGSPAPAKGGIKLTDNLRHIENYSFETSEKIRKLCDDQRSAVMREMSATPDDEAIRMMQAVSLRGDSVSRAELDAMWSKFGGNYQVRRFIADQMLKRELGHPAEDVCDKALRDIARAEEVGINNCSTSRIQNSRLGAASRLAIAKEQLYERGLFGMQG